MVYTEIPPAIAGIDGKKQSLLANNFGVFAGAQNLTIFGGTFNNHNVDNAHNIGFSQLQRSIAMSAIHNSAERASAIHCHPGTRTELMRSIKSWILGQSCDKKMLWLSGKAGVGKSVVMQDLADMFSPDSPSAKDDLGSSRVLATFFFHRGRAKLNNCLALFPTLAYQLALHIPGLRLQINEVMLHNPSLLEQSPKKQLNDLIVAPLQRLEPIVPSPTIIIDGLDECGEDDEQLSTLSLISDALCTGRLSARFIITSRPEVHLCDAFSQTSISDITLPLFHHGSYEDVKRFLRDGFGNIHARKSHLMRGVAPPWPTDDVMNKLVEKSSGHFIYASTVVRFVDAKHKSPTSQLEVIMNMKPTPVQAQAFLKLDNLYTQILDTFPEKELLCSFLSMMASQKVGHHVDTLESILGPDSVILLDSLASLLDLNDGYISPSHASFIDYIMDENRSGQYYSGNTNFLERVKNMGDKT